MLKDSTTTQEFFSDLLERRYLDVVSESDCKKLGQFFTPFPIAEFMARWVLANPQCQTILDPAVGLGVFLRAVIKHRNNQMYRLRGYDVDAGILEAAKDVFIANGYSDVELVNQDYMFNDWNTRYDGIICNPPYLKFQQYKNRSQSLQEIQARLGITLSGFSNIYTLFILKSINQLANNGRAAYIVPPEFLNADYGKAVKKYLIQNKTLRYIIIFDFNEAVFDNAITTSCVLLFANDNIDQPVRFIKIKSIGDLLQLSHVLIDYPDRSVVHSGITFADLDPNIKWRAYYQQQRAKKYNKLVPFSAYGKIVRGIATGNNHYFTFDEKKKQEFGIDDRFLLPCITKAMHANTSYFTTQDFEHLRTRGKRVFLLNATSLDDPAVKAYIELGEKLAVHTRYLTSHRNPWYSIENRPPAPIFVTVFDRNGLRFVRNETGVRNLTCFHSFYPDILMVDRIDLLMAYLLTDISRELFNENRREYGQGLRKFEPNDLNNAMVADLSVISAKDEREILAMYQAYRTCAVLQQPAGSLLDQLNQRFLAFLHA